MCVRIVISLVFTTLALPAVVYLALIHSVLFPRMFMTFDCEFMLLEPLPMELLRALDWSCVPSVVDIFFCQSTGALSTRDHFKINDLLRVSSHRGSMNLASNPH